MAICESPCCLRVEPAFVFAGQSLRVKWTGADCDTIGEEDLFVSRETLASFIDIPFTSACRNLICSITANDQELLQLQLKLRGDPVSRLARASHLRESRHAYHALYDYIIGLPFEAMLMQAHADLVRRKAELVMVTGSVGKTSTKELIAHLSPTQTTYHSTDSWNFPHDSCAQILLNPWALKYVFEMAVGTHLPTVGALLPPSVLVFTHLGPVHTAQFDSVSEIGHYKASLARNLGSDATIILNADVREIEESLNEWLTGGATPRIIRYSSGLREDCDVVIRRENEDELLLYDRRRASSFRLRQPRHVSTRPANIAAAYCERSLADPEYAALEDDLATFDPPPRRLQLEDAGPAKLLNDVYNANPISMRELIETLTDRQHSGLTVGAILAEMADLGDCSLDEHTRLFHEARGCFSRTIFVGPTYRRVGALTAEGCDYQESASELAESALIDELLEQCDLIGVKGSYCTHMELVVDALKAHGKGMTNGNNTGI